jgi:hypothetical protein
MHRRELLKGLAITVAAPFVIRTPGLLMPVRNRLVIPPLSERELRLQGLIGTRDWDLYPASLAEVKEWRRGQKRNAERGIMLSYTGIGWAYMDAMINAEKRYKARGLL